MAKLTSKSRKRLPASAFGLPKTRQYPEEDRAHAINAKARAEEMYKRGKLSLAQKREIDRRADKKLGK